MATIQCKQCGGEVDLPEGMTSGVCPYCNSLTTFPKITDPRMEQLYVRAEQFRRNSDFDKAVSAYEQLIQMDPEDPEYYWGLVISRYGIEYVEDPVSHERIPTCHRVQYDSILADADYQSVLSLSSGYDRDIYEKEANRIAEIQKGILTISAQEKPYDVFICYKETTDGGTRTWDSTLAQDIYYQLTNIGYKVFFARITLEDKLGQQYEPYIFAALNSAKVMLVIGSKKEFFEAVWVRNEWSRFLALMKKDRTKLLIPCYSGMDPYDLPTELSMFQAQDMSKIGFLQDLIHGIRKVVDAAKEPPAEAASGGGTTVSSGASLPIDNLLKRIRFFLGDRNFADVKEYCNKILDADPDNAYAYFCQFMAELEMTDENAVPKYDGDPSELGSCKRLLASDMPELRAKVEEILENHRGNIFLEQAREQLARFEEDPKINNIKAGFLQDLAGSRELIRAVELLTQAGPLGDAPKLLEQSRSRLYEVVTELSTPEMIESIADPNLAKEEVVLCRVLSKFGIKASPLEYSLTMADMNEEGITASEQDRINDEFVANDFKEKLLEELILSMFDALGDYRDSADLRRDFQERELLEFLNLAEFEIDRKNYALAVNILSDPKLRGFRNADELLEREAVNCYSQGVDLMDNGRFKDAYTCFAVLGDYEDAVELAEECSAEHSRKIKKLILIGLGALGVVVLLIFGIMS